MGEYDHIIRVILELDTEAEIDFPNQIEVSLPCNHCERTKRTISFKAQNSEPVKKIFKDKKKRILSSFLKKSNASCTTYRKEIKITHGYPGYLITELGKFKAVYTIEFDSKEFIDSKHGEARPWSSMPIWARINFNAICPSCKYKNECSTQTNLIRPFTEKCKFCQEILYSENREWPIIEKLEGEV